MAKKQDPMTKKKRGDKVLWHERELKKKRKERMGYHERTHALFFALLIPLERFRWDDFNHTLKDHQMRS